MDFDVIFYQDLSDIQMTAAIDDFDDDNNDDDRQLFSTFLRTAVLASGVYRLLYHGYLPRP
jgi:hypothetical protein